MQDRLKTLSSQWLGGASGRLPIDYLPAEAPCNTQEIGSNLLCIQNLIKVYN
jgi:hypothetical protein